MATITAYLSPYARLEGRPINTVLLVNVVNLTLNI